MNIALMSYVYGYYQDFIPLYVYSALKNNPHINIKIFVKEELTPRNRELTDRFATDKVQIIENYSIPCPIWKLGGIRALIPEKEFAEFDYIYLSDIDIIDMVNMEDRCLQYDLRGCKRTGLPFNGAYYKSYFYGVEEYLPRFNMCCVFIEVKPYYEKMTKIIDNIFSDDHKEYMKKIKNLGSDELLLYYMLDQTFDWDLSLFVRQRPHGINLHSMRYGYGQTEIPTTYQFLIDDMRENGFLETKRMFDWNDILTLKTL